MKTTVKALIVAGTLALPMAGPVAAQDTATISMGQSMLIGSLMNSLNRMNIDTSNVNSLTLSEIAEIRGILEDDDTPETQQKKDIEAILEN